MEALAAHPKRSLRVLEFYSGVGGMVSPVTLILA